MLLPVYGSSVLVSVLVHKRGHVVGRCVFKLYGLLPLLLRDHSKSLTLYRCGAHSQGCLGCRHQLSPLLAKLICVVRTSACLPHMSRGDASVLQMQSKPAGSNSGEHSDSAGFHHPIIVFLGPTTVLPRPRSIPNLGVLQ